MYKSNLFEQLRIFSPKEFKEFGDFVKSAFFNKNENVINLYNHIKRYYPDLDNPALEKQRAYKELTGSDKYNDGYMRTIIFNLSKLAEDFLALAVKIDIEQEILLLNTYFHRGSDKLFEKKMKQVSDYLAKEKNKDQYHFYCMYRMQSLKMSYNSKNRAFLNVKDFHEADEIKTLDSLLNFYLLSALPEFRFFYNQANVVNIDFEFSFLEDIINFLKRSGFHKRVPELNLHFNALLLAKENKEENYFNLKEIVMSGLENFPFGVQYNVVGILANKAVTEYYRGKDKFLKERFDIHNFIIEKGLYKKFEDGFFDDMLFKNCVIVGLQLNEIEWTEKFINDNIDKLSLEDKENAYNLNTARLFFYKNDYEESLKRLAEIKTIKHVHYKTEIKILTLMIYTEQNKNNEAMTVIDNYKHFLSNDALLPQVRKERSYNFLKFTADLIRAKENNSSALLHELEFDIKNNPNTYEKEWLLQKTEKFLKEFK